ncbi:protein kinase domain-containing protein [Microbacterium enclense]|uniref:protein kinase domain-containing protein n=1 Tax=Microbacterium enclense TaxID=993073 RepID=UPI0034434901
MNGSKSRFGPWRMEGDLGEGTFSAVYLVERDGQQGALKPAMRGAREAAERLKVESDSLPLFDHPSIPKLLDDDLDAEEPFIVMSVAPGDTLRKRIDDWNAKGRVHGEIEALDVVTQLLRAVAHMHQRDMVHRDIKDANIMYDGETVSLIDFGFCKKNGTKDSRTGDSLWRAGAGRFAPLQKLENHILAITGHDVFAVGVVSYRLLTGHFPYGVEDMDIPSLKTRYESFRPPSVHEVNRFVSLPFSRLVDSMLEMNDDDRISASDALARCEELHENSLAFQAEALGPINGRIIRARRTQFPHVVRDAVLGDIRLTDQEYRVLSTKSMQRLRWIRQLGLTNLVYPGADHSRLSHCIGAVGVAERMMRAIEDESGVRIDTDVRIATRLYALTHDIPHIAFGHTIEDQLGYFIRHDENEPRFDRLLGQGTETSEALNLSAEGRAVLELLRPGGDPPRDSFVYQAVSGDMGADVLDYLDRDAFYCGLDHRVDSAIFRQLVIQGRPRHGTQRVVSNVTGKYGIRIDRTFAIDSVLTERYAMFLKVYTHSAKIAADAVLDKALRAFQGRSKALPEADFERLGDEAMLHAMQKRTASKKFAQMLLERRLPRGVFRSRLAETLSTNDLSVDHQAILNFLSEESYLVPSGRAALEARIAKVADVHADKIFFYVPRSAPGHKRAQLWVSTDRNVASRHPVTDLANRHLKLWELWVFCDSSDPGERARVQRAAEDVIGLTNSVTLRETLPSVFAL